MPLTNAQYDSILQKIRDRRDLHLLEAEARLEEVKAALPAFSELEKESIRLHMEAARRRVMDKDASLRDIDKQLQEINTKKATLLASAGYPEDYTEPVFDCAICEDRGVADGTRCECFQREAINLLYENTGLSDLLAEENFAHFDFRFYSDTMKNELTGKTAYETAKDAVEQAKAFVERLGEKDNHLFLYGNTGVGKSFLSHCIAKALLDRSHTVLTFSAQELFDVLADASFLRGEAARTLTDTVFSCDCLIIDDLGTELTNSFVAGKLFQIINERLQHAKSMVISTNLSLEEFQEKYTERVFSRISGHFQIIKLIGDDIRFLKHHRNA